MLLVRNRSDSDFNQSRRIDDHEVRRERVCCDRGRFHVVPDPDRARTDTHPCNSGQPTPRSGNSSVRSIAIPPTSNEEVRVEVERMRGKASPLGERMTEELEASSLGLVRKLRRFLMARQRDGRKVGRY